MPVLYFIDNDSATACVIKGYSPRCDSAAIVGDFWLRVASRKIFLYADRVESKSNIADGPSRLFFDDVLALGSVWTEANTSLFDMPDPGRNPFHWFAQWKVPTV